MDAAGKKDFSIWKDSLLVEKLFYNYKLHNLPSRVLYRYKGLLQEVTYINPKDSITSMVSFEYNPQGEITKYVEYTPEGFEKKKYISPIYSLQRAFGGCHLQEQYRRRTHPLPIWCQGKSYWENNLSRSKNYLENRGEIYLLWGNTSCKITLTIHIVWWEKSYICTA